MITIKVEFKDIIKLDISDEGRLELTLKDERGEEKTSWLNGNQMEQLMMELSILRNHHLIKYMDELRARQ